MPVTAAVQVDDVGLVLLRTYNWWVISRQTPSGRVYRYLETKIAGKPVLFHRLLLNASPGTVIDHINGDGLDNRRSNLRACSHAENMRNRRINANHSHGFKGVGRRKNGLYYAQIRAAGVRRFRGGFGTAEEAAAAYADMAAELHGEFARVDVLPRLEK